MSFELDRKEYLDYVENGVNGKLTRGLVVDTNDPLYSGRVRVWIPMLHGGVIDAPVSDDDTTDESSLFDEEAATGKLGQLTDTAIACLPWAPVLGHNWGATADFSSTVPQSLFGVYNIPKEGTEVFIIFEDDNPNLPVVIGAVFHQAELLQNSRIKSLEMSPGLLISNDLTDSDEREAYSDRVAQSYVILSEKGSHLIITDLDGQEQINLGSYINLKKNPVIVDDGSPNSKYTLFSNEFPNFPTTASAPFRKRNSVNTENPIFDTNISFAKPANTSSTQAPATPPTSTPATPSTPATTTGGSVTVKKTPPVDKAWPKITKNTYKDFRYDRSTPGKHRIHWGVDLSVTKANLVAPIDCIPLAYTDSPSGGKMLFIKGVDGYCHAFLHLDSVLPELILDLKAGRYKKYTAGTVLGVTGNTGAVEGAGGGYHLHWEVYKGGDIVKTGSDVVTLREFLRKPGKNVLKGQTIVGESYTGTYCYVHPLEEWLRQDTLVDANGQPVTTTVTMQAGQLDSYSAVYATTGSPDFDKVIGIEMCLTPGAEHIFMRHPSGGFAGFDADGNWKVYTPGNAEYKVNRNLVFDVLGGILTNSLAFYARAKSVIRLMSSTIPRLLSKIGDPEDPKTDLPNIYKRIEAMRKRDMEDAIKQSSSNVYYSLSDTMVGKSVADIQKDGYAYSFDPSTAPGRDYTNNKFDGIIKAAHAKFVPTNHALAEVITPQLIKSVMLKESNGDPNPKTNKAHAGLFQLGAGAISDITKQKEVNPADYLDPTVNTEIGVQFIVKCCDIMLSAVKKANLQISTKEDKEHVLKAALMGYNYGPYGIKNLYANVTAQSNTLVYPALEQRFINDNAFQKNPTKGKETLEYAPHIMWMAKNKVTI